jgi:hypothetical protein
MERESIVDQVYEWNVNMVELCRFNSALDGLNKKLEPHQTAGARPRRGSLLGRPICDKQDDPAVACV